jgi:integrase
VGIYQRKYKVGGRTVVDTRWRYRKWVTLPDGSRVRISGTGAFNTQRAALTAEAAHVDRVLHPERHPKPEAPKKVPMFAEFWRERYFPTLTTDAPSTIEAKGIHFTRHLEPAVGALELTAIDRRALDVLKAELFKPTKHRPGLGPKTVRNILATLRHALAMAVEWEDLGALPRWPKFKLEDSEWDHLTVTEAKALLSAARDKRDRLLLWFALATGARAGEQLAVEWSDVTWADGAEQVRFRRSHTHGITGPTKSKRHRSVPLSPELADALREARNEAGGRDLVFADIAGKMLRIGQLHECLWRTLKRAELRRVRWHDLRHSFASHLAAAGVPLNVVQARMGHSTILMTMRYAHLAPDQNRLFVDLTAPARGQRVGKTTSRDVDAADNGPEIN